MTFRELLEKYKEGSLTEDERKLVEDELEKNEAINNYLSENLDLNFVSSGETKLDITTNNVRKTVNRKLFKVVALSVIIVFAILFSVKYIVSPLVASRYYNPARHTMDKFTEDFLYDFRALNELINPGYGVSYASARDNGFGNYSLTFESNNLFTQERLLYNGELKKDEPYGIYDYFSNNTTVLYNRMWADPKNNESYKKPEYEKEGSKKKIEHLKALPDTSYVSAYMLLDEMLTLYELSELTHEYESIRFNWVAVQVSDESLSLPIGFRIDPYGDGSSGDNSYYKEYPGLLLGDFYSNDPDSSSGPLLGYRKHFLSLLKYLSNHNDAAQALTHYDLDFNQYLDYVENNGINIYGLLVFGSSKDLVMLYENENIQTINIDNILPSIYSIKYNN